jgi:hypothetical protein
MKTENFCANKDNLDGLNPYCRDCAQDKQLRIKYGITSATYFKMLADQDGLCAICKTDACPTGRRFVVDHNHACCPTQKTCGQCLRKLLCGPCNKALGLFKDSPDILRAAASYVEDN